MNFENFYTTGDYLSKNPEWGAEDSGWKGMLVAKLLDKNNISFNTMAEVGCGAGGILHYLYTKYKGKDFYGYDISPQSIAIAKEKFANEKGLHFTQADYINEDHPKTDILLMLDVIEHVTDYYDFLNKMKQKSKQFVFHIPLDVSCRTILKPHILLQQRKTVGHIHYFTEEYVWWMLEDCGYSIKDWRYTKLEIDVVKPKTFKQAVKKVLRKLSYSISKKWSVKLWGGYSLLILAE